MHTKGNLTIYMIIMIITSLCNIYAYKKKQTLFYIIANAQVEFQNEIYVVGATNLPKGSIITITITDTIGTGSAEFSNTYNIIVNNNHKFNAKILSRKGFTFWPGLECDIAFDPMYPKQSKHVLSIVGGPRGTNLGSPQNNPEVSGSYNHKILDISIVVQ